MRCDFKPDGNKNSSRNPVHEDAALEGKPKFDWFFTQTWAEMNAEKSVDVFGCKRQKYVFTNLWEMSNLAM